MIELRHLQRRHLANGCTAKMLFHRFDIISLYIICQGAIICDIHTTLFVQVYACRVSDTLVASCATVH